MSGARPRLFSIRAGVPFLPTLAHHLMDGTLVEGFRFEPDNPLSMGQATIFVPTRRAARVLRSAIVDLGGTGSAILPEIRALGETDEDDGLDADDVGDSLDLEPPVGGLERTLELARLVLGWRNALPDHILALFDGSPIVAPASPADAIWLAKSLASLIDSIETEECDWARVGALETGDLAEWWQLTARFMTIASRFWPDRLAELGRSSPARHRAARIDRQAARFAAGAARGPVIIAGSTGSVPATARLIATVARMPKGCVVLPGLDLDMAEADWSLAGGLMDDGRLDPGPASRSHPQYGLFQLLARLGVTRDAVIELGRPDDAIIDRQAILSAALLPSRSTARWPDFRAGFTTERLDRAFADVTLVEAGNEREEATAIAIALKLAVAERPDSQAALVTPDRKLARRVGLELARFGIEADDSAGTPLLSSPAGSLVHLALDAALGSGDPVTLAGLLKHPLVRMGRTEEDHLADVSALERLVLRNGTGTIAIEALESRLDEALIRLTTETHRKAWQDSLPADAADRARGLVQRLSSALAPFAPIRASAAPARFAVWAQATGEAVEALAIDERGSLAGLWTGPAGDALAGLLSGLMADRSGMEAHGRDWIDVMKAMMAGEGVPPGHVGHPRIFIWGTLEARLQHVDTLVLGGMNEGIWPSRTANDPFLSRTMKTAIGLEPPERRIGQNAHDFMMAASETRLVLTRAMRDGGTPTVASRFLQRILALSGEDTARALRQRGRLLLDQVEALDIGEASDMPGRPAPRPPARLQPTRYSFSEVTRLRRDPYSVYARRILRLDPLDPFVADPGPAERGTLYHEAAETLVLAAATDGYRKAKDAIPDIIEQVFGKAGLPPHVEAIWRPGLVAILDALLAHDAERDGEIRQTLTEVTGRLVLPGGALTISGRADRIDILHDGSADIVDYKTGSNPSMKTARTLVDPQLALEAAVLARGGFGQTGPLKVRNLTYVRLRPGSRFAVETVNDAKHATSDLADNALAELAKLVIGLSENRFGFVSRLIPASDRDHGGDYDHLARVAEWSTAEAAEDDDE